MAWCGAVWLALLVCAPAAAQGPSWGYVDYAHSWLKLQEDLSGEGDGIFVSLPLSERWFVAGSAAESEARYDDPMIADVERRESINAGIGIHSIGRKGHVYALLSHSHIELTSSAAAEEQREGAVFAMGYRYMERPWLVLEPEFGLGHYDHTYDFQSFLRIKAAVRVVPRAWVVASYSSGLTPMDDGNVLALGVRLAWRDSTPERKVPPAVRAPSGEGATLAVGQSVVTVWALRLQEQPAFGARETVAVPAGETVQLIETRQNSFGRWWRVRAGDEEGWIREGHLK
jgi:hypothetical protein